MSEMIRTVAPPVGAGPFNVTRACVDAPPSTVPGSGWIHSRSRPGGVAGDATTRKLPLADHGPATAPRSARTRQKYVPGGSRTSGATTYADRLTPWTSRTPNEPAKFGSVSTSRSYADTCGFGVSVQSNMNGTDTVAPPTGDCTVGAGPTGAVLTILTFSVADGSPRTLSNDTARTR